MSKRETQRLTRRALKATGLSPEAFAKQYATYLWNASGRTVRRWADGDSVPHASVRGSLRVIAGESRV